MTTIKRNLFLVGTPYQLITAFNLSSQKYNSNEFENVIYFSRSDKTNYEVSLDSFESNIKIVRFTLPEWPTLIKKLQEETYFRFFFFQENSIYNKYLAYYLKKKGTIIALGPDGTKPYGVFDKKHELLSMFKDTISDYKLLNSKGLRLPDLIWSRYYRYGSFKLLDEVWLQYPDLFEFKKNKTKGEIKQLPDLSLDTIKQLATLLNFNNPLKQSQNIILYFNQPFYSKVLIEKEFEILEQITNVFPDKEITIKLHPGTNPEVKKRMATISYLNVIADNMPAEFYLAMVSDSIILTGWSAATMHDFPLQNNSNYYLYPLYKETNDKTLSQINLVGFPHIQMVTSVHQLLKK